MPPTPRARQRQSASGKRPRRPAAVLRLTLSIQRRTRPTQSLQAKEEGPSTEELGVTAASPAGDADDDLAEYNEEIHGSGGCIRLCGRCGDRPERRQSRRGSYQGGVVPRGGASAA